MCEFMQCMYVFANNNHILSSGKINTILVTISNFLGLSNYNAKGKMTNI